jgi:hypothetical protein
MYRYYFEYDDLSNQIVNLFHIPLEEDISKYVSQATRK